MVKCQLKFNNLNYSYNIFYSRSTIGLKTLIKLYSGIRIIYECLFESFSKWVFWKSHQDAMRRNTLKTRLQYQGSTPHIPSTWQQIFCSDSLALFLTLDYMVVPIFLWFTADLVYFCLNYYLSPFHHWYMPRRCYLCLLRVLQFWKTS